MDEHSNALAFHVLDCAEVIVPKLQALEAQCLSSGLVANACLEHAERGRALQRLSEEHARNIVALLESFSSTELTERNAVREVTAGNLMTRFSLMAEFQQRGTYTTVSTLILLYGGTEA